MNNEKILAVPTHVVTGFLGVGKTSVIMTLLNQKPKNERWAVLVNEFGEIGVDGALLGGKSLASNNVYIKEVPGGCMCCASGVPMQIALNQLLTQARPHRLLIEPTGLGHPHEVLKVLSNQFYRKTLSLEKTLTLVDARNLKDSRYTSHDTFNQQLEIADVIVGNKSDLYEEGDKATLTNYLASKNYTPDKVYFTEHGAVELAWLQGKTNTQQNKESCTKNDYKGHSSHHHKKSSEQEGANDREIPESGFIKAINQGEGYQSVGWRFAKSQQFNHKKLIDFLTSIDAIRVKSVFITTNGVYGYNRSADGFNEMQLQQTDETRIEIICDTVDLSWDEFLHSCLETRELLKK